METLIKKLIKENIHLSVKGSDLEIHFNGDVLPTDLIQELKKNKQELIHYIQTKESKKVEEGTIIKNYREEYRESGKPVPLSFAQERMWFVDQLAGTLPYHNPTAYSVFGNIYPPLFEQAFRALVDRHEVLHTVVKAVDGHPQQVLFPSEEWTMNYYDEINFENDDEIKAFLQKEIQRPFDLSQDSPLRVSMIKTEAKHHILLMVNHHIATDDWSSEIMMKEFQLLFNALSQGADPQLPQLPIQYADFAIWQRLEFGEEGLVKQQKFWKEHLNEATDFEFPTDFPRPVHKSSRGARGDIQTTPELAQQINQLGKQEGATAFMLMLAAFKTLFYKYTQQEDICLGAPIAGRTIKEVEPLIGFFVNTLPMRSQIDPQQSFRSYLGEVKKTTLNAYANQQVPFEQIVEVAGANRALDRDPLFQITLTSLGPQGVGGEEAGPAIDPSDIPEGAVQIVPYSNDLNLMAQRDMSLYFVEKAGRYLLGTFYCADLYEQVTIDRMLEHFINLLSSIVENPDGKIADLNILSGKEKKQLLLEFNKTNAPYPQDQSIADLFEAQVQKTPQHTALRFGDKSWTYQELNEEAESLAKHLQSQYQVKPGDFVGLMMSRSEWMIISILGILKAGAAYVPIDPSLPGERKNFIIEDTKLKLMIILSESLFDMNLMEVDSLAIDIQLDMIKESESSTVLDRQSTAKDPAYVMYTSGTTGKPKGIVVNQVNVIKLSKEAKEIAVFESDRVLQWSNYAFDGSVYEIFSSLLNGASLHMIANQDAADPNRLAKVLREQDISILFITTALFNAFVDVELAALKGLRKILFGGELVSPLHVQRALAELGPDSIIHVYGPTETTVYATYYPVREAKDLNVPIGRPLSNTKIYLVTESGHLAGIGVQGEIWIGGDGVAQRYLNRPELTAEKFIDNPFTHTKDARIYKTGDLAKMLPDGNIEFIGRKDSQIKMRGYRIELGEIETVLQKLDQVQQAVVLAKKDPSGTKQLVAYVVPANGQFDKAQIQNELKTHLPEYMVPAMMMEIEKMPLNANGKIDKRALPEPDTSNIASKEYVAPTSETEQKIAKIWQELLEVEQVGINDDFFELGGHSLLATRVISELRTQLNIEVAIRDMFQHTNVKDLAIFIDQQAPESDLPKIKIQPRPERIPLSYAQERLWFVDRLQGSVQYHIPMILKVSGDLNLELFEYGFKEVIDRHELLRTVIKEENGVSYQEIIDSDNWSMDLIQDPKYFDRKVLDPLINELVGRPFNLSEEYPIRVHMIQLNEAGEYLFIANLHHIATDGWSNSIMVDEFVQFYTAMEKGEKAALPPLPIQFADYAIWERQTHDKSALEKQLDFWMEQLNGVSQLDLPTDYPRPALQSFRGGTEAMAFSKELSDQIVDFANQYDVTPFMVFLAAFKNLLYKYSGQEDICIGSPIAGRTIKEVESLIGFFVNTLTLRSQIDPEMSFLDLLSTVKGTLLDAYANQLVPFEQIVERLGVERDLSRTPIFSITLSYQNTPDTKEKSLGNIRFEGMDSDNLEITTQRDLSVFVEESPHGFIVAMNYCIDLYKGSTITQMMEHFSMLLSAIIKDPEQKIGHLSMTTPEERNQLLLGFNDTALPYPGDQSIIDLFEAQVAKTPEHTALVCKGQSWTYQELNKKANILAQLLKEEFELGKGDFVGIMMPRSEWMIIALLGILKTEAAYVPLDLSHPSDRKAFVAEDTDLKALILLSENIFDVTTLDVPGLAIDIQFSEFEEQFPDEAPEREGGSQHPAYVMYTSGTTGKPKGIVVRQQNVVKLAKESNEIAIFDHDRVLQWSNFAFDGSVYEIFASLLSGASLHLIPGQDASDPIQLAKHIKEQELTVAFITTALFNALVDFEASSLQPLRKILFGGEMVSTQHVAKALEVLGTEKVIHVYGPTETTVYASYHPIQSCEGNTVPIGKPLSNTQIYIVDKNGDHAGIGVVGEVWIGGDGVASGYLNRPKLTADKFIDNPFAPHSGSIYKTGDLARFLPDGNIEFIGRRDSQIKMRGYRIELGEIEAALNQNPAVQQAHVSAQKDPSGTKQLVAYIVAQGDFNPDTLKSTLKTKLPEYMVPAIMVELEALPLTPNGKVDKKALPAPDVANMSQKEYVAPRNEIEAKVAAIWKVLLELTEDISIHHDFFELGGHSLLATRVISEVRDQFNVELAIKDLFQATTVAQLAQLIEEKEQAIVLPKLVVQDRPERIPLSYAQERLWFIDQVEGSLHYHIPNLFKIQGTFNQTAFEKAFQTIVNRHELLRTVIKEEQGLAYQEILPINQWSMQVNSAHEGLSKEQVTALVDEVIIRPFDLAQDHPLRVEVIKVKEDEHIMVMIMHHIASDGWSSGIFLDEFNALYNAYEKGEELTLDPLDIQYADFAIWQRKYHSGALLKQQIDYWKEQLQHNTPLSIPLDFPRPAMQSFRGANSGVFINRELTDRLNDLANQKEVTPFMLLLAAFKALLYRYGRQGDISVGTPVAGRTTKEVESLIGFFVNTLVIRSQVEAELPFDQYLETIKQTTLNAFANQMAPFEKIVEALDIERDPSRNPIFQVMFAYQNAPSGDETPESDLRISPANTTSVNLAQRDISITISEMPQGLIIGMNYCADLFLQSTMDQMMLHYSQLLQAIVAQPDLPIGQL
ncbi:MAG: amino acid adenylation domain-containing protein, partial [Bacteroidota bacterium]